MFPGTTFDTDDVVSATECMKNDYASILFEEVMKCMRIRNNVSNTAEVLGVMREGCAPPRGEGLWATKVRLDAKRVSGARNRLANGSSRTHVTAIQHRAIKKKNVNM